MIVPDVGSSSASTTAIKRGTFEEGNSGLPLPALIAIPLFSVFIGLTIVFVAFSCIRNRRHQAVFKKTTEIPKIDLNSQPAGFEIDGDHQITPYPAPAHETSSSPSSYPMLNSDAARPLSLQPSLESRESAARPAHSRSPSQEALLRDEAIDLNDLHPPSYHPK
ncbi:uncharacterized protein I303_108263 [Kwoniella dejecticola CBS 10117]|uniref:Uncharacterized protein n=1 Tax=Kwoniella dejecticola CBS 10117 TaxID=1296121 RepID=A0A1A5ZXW2_9TREE|nr:uncharacterized protein I303_07410 [Kwoniella dejecticola CBS 10117]OBR82647.1 hypothetical protein I303_07410 [Kwoniella dejecticola CBS 10117]